MNLNTEQRKLLVEMLKDYIQENGYPLYVDGEKVIDKGFIVGNSDMFIRIESEDYFYQLVMSDKGSVFRACYDLVSFAERFQEEHGYEWDYDYSDIDYDNPNFIRKMEIEWDDNLHYHFRDGLDEYIESFSEQFSVTFEELKKKIKHGGINKIA